MTSAIATITTGTAVAAAAAAAQTSAIAAAAAVIVSAVGASDVGGGGVSSLYHFRCTTVATFRHIDSPGSRCRAAATLVFFTVRLEQPHRLGVQAEKATTSAFGRV